MCVCVCVRERERALYKREKSFGVGLVLSGCFVHRQQHLERHTQINAHFSVLIADFSFFFSLSRLNLLNFRVDLRHEE